MTDRTICTVEGCQNLHLARGLCTKHYKRLRRNGDPTKSLRPANGTTQKWIRETALSHASDECLIWPFQPDKYGRAVLNFGGRRHYASRYICELAHGKPPSDQHVAAHSCGKGHSGCVNPKHLRWATRSENYEDSVLHGTAARGERLPNTKLSADDVRTIRKLRPEMTFDRIAERYNVARSTIIYAVYGRNWSWLE